MTNKKTLSTDILLNWIWSVASDRWVGKSTLQEGDDTTFRPKNHLKKLQLSSRNLRRRSKTPPFDWLSMGLSLIKYQWSRTPVTYASTIFSSALRWGLPIISSAQPAYGLFPKVWLFVSEGTDISCSDEGEWQAQELPRHMHFFARRDRYQ